MKLQRVLRWLCTALFVGVGVTHFTHTADFVSIMPAYLPFHRALVLISGVFEILGGIGLQVPSWRRFSAWGLLALLVAVFPANLNMAMHGITLGSEWLTPAMLWLRLPFQLVLMAAVWGAGLWEPEKDPVG